MKKIISVLLALTLIVVPIFTLKASNQIRIVVNGEKINFPDAQPFLDENNRTQVPVRFVSEALGAEVNWDGKSQKVTIKRNKDVVILTIGKKEISVNGVLKALDTKAVLIQERTFVPIRFVSEALGATVRWDPDISTAYIDINKDSTAQEKGTLVEHKGGFWVPRGSQLNVSDYDSDYTEQSFMIDFDIINANVPQMMLDLKTAIESKYGKIIADEVYDYISQKDKVRFYLQRKTIYVKEYNQYIVINGSSKTNSTIAVSIFLPGKDPNNLDR